MRNESLLVTATGILSIAGCHGGGDDPTDRGPTASAGADQIVDERSIVQLAGSGASADGAVTFAWSQLSGSSLKLSSTTIANPTFTAPLVPIGTTDVIELRLEVRDSAGAVTSDTVRISAKSSDWVLYTDIRSGFAGIYAFDAEANSRTTLVELAGLASSFPRIAPDGSRITYVDNAFDVWSVRRDGTGRVNLGSSRARGYFLFDSQLHIFSPGDAAWSPDGTHIIYSADRDLDDVRELYVVRADGSHETQLPYDLSWSLQWSPDGARIGLLRRVAGAYEVYSMRPDGTDAVKLTDATVDAVSGFAWSPDGTRIAYAAAAPSQPPGELSLFTVRADGTERTRVLGPDVSTLDWLPIGSLVAKAALGNTNDYGLFTMQPDGSALAKLSGPVTQGHFLGSPSWPRDASRILFGIFESYSTSGTPWPPGDLFTVRPDGTGLVQLNDVRLVGKGVGAYWWAPDGSRIVYRGPQATGGVVELFSVRSDGTGRVRLNADLPPGAELLVPPTWSPDSSRVVVLPERFVRDGNLGYGARDAFTVRADGTDRVQLNAPLAPRRTVGEQADWAPDSSRLIYYEYQFPSDGTDPLRDTFSVLPDGTGRVKLNPDTASKYGASWSPDGARLLYGMTDQSSKRVTVGISRPDGTGLVPIKEWNPGEGGTDYFRWAP